MFKKIREVINGLGDQDEGSVRLSDSLMTGGVSFQLETGDSKALSKPFYLLK